MNRSVKERHPRKFSPIDQVIGRVDRVLKTVAGGATQCERESPASNKQNGQLSSEEKKHVSGLMRINHTGEVCAQALYQGQALTARDDKVKRSMEVSAREEEDHLAWCEQRLKELNSRPSVLNPIFYGMSFGLGALAGLAGDKWSLGFVAATEDQVCKHLSSHLEQLPEQDNKSIAILNQMLKDEAQHASKAMEAGGVEFNPKVKSLMTAVSGVMTKTTYRI